jgi:hypothetical protein
MEGTVQAQKAHEGGIRTKGKMASPDRTRTPAEKACSGIPYSISVHSPPVATVIQYVTDLDLLVGSSRSLRKGFRTTLY